MVLTQRLIAIGGFDDTFRRAQDFELGVRLTNIGMSLAWPQTAILLGYLIHASGVTATSYREQFLAAELVRHRLAEGNAVAYEPWVASKSHSINLRRRALSGSYYRLAAVRSRQGRAAAKWAAAAAALTLDPIEVLKELQGRASPGVSQQPAATVPNAVLDLLNETSLSLLPREEKKDSHVAAARLLIIALAASGPALYFASAFIDHAQKVRDSAGYLVWTSDGEPSWAYCHRSGLH